MRTQQNNLMLILWHGKWTILVVTILFACLGVYIALTTPDKYKAEVLLAPSESDATSGLAGLASQFGGLAGLAGISVQGSEGNKVGEALALLSSRAFIQEFIREREILPELLAALELNESNGLLTLDPSVYDQQTNTWVRTPPKNKQVVPTPWEGYPVLINNLDINEMSQDGTVTIELESLSPVLAKRWLEWLVNDLNAKMAKRDLEEAKRSIEYLHQQIAETQVHELQKIFYSLIEEQTKKIMLGKVREDYVFKVLAGPILPEEKSAPSRALICITFTFIGGLLGILIVVIRRVLFPAKA